MNGGETALRSDVRPGDMDGVRAIVESTGFFSAQEADVALELVGERMARGENSGYHFIFADQGGALAGFACFGPIPGTRASFDLYWIAVAAAARGCGIGSLLIRASEQAVAAQGGRRIYVETSARTQYDPTRAFYMRHGYQPEAFLADFYAPGDGKVILVKVIGGAGA